MHKEAPGPRDISPCRRQKAVVVKVSEVEKGLLDDITEVSVVVSGV